MFRKLMFVLLLCAVSNKAQAQECESEICTRADGKPEFFLLPQTYKEMTPQELYDHIRLSPELAERFYSGIIVEFEPMDIKIDSTTKDAQNPFYRKGLVAFANNDLCNAAKFFQAAATEGHRGAQYAMAHTTFMGAGIPANKPLAKAWFRNAIKPDTRAVPRPLAWVYFRESVFFANVTDIAESDPSKLHQTIVCHGA